MNRFSMFTLMVACVGLTTACEDSPESKSPSSTDEQSTGYLNGLTEADVIALSTHYGLNADEFSVQASAPFTCDNYGDLCSNVGDEAAEDIIGLMLDLMVAEVPVEDIQSEVQAEVRRATDAWTEVLEGMPETWAGSPHVYDYDYYTIATGTTSYSCRLKVEADINNFGLWVDQCATARNYCNLGGSWYSVKVDVLKVKITAKRTSASSVTTENDTQYDTDVSTEQVCRTLSSGGSHRAYAEGWVTESTVPSGTTVYEDATATYY